MENNPTVSIVMPIYNRAYCVADAVRSCIDQTFEDWELIVVDDGSVDSEQLIKKLQRFDDERIRYERIPHCGNISKVRNYGNSLARGKYIVVHDSDDMAFPNRLEEIVKVFTTVSIDAGEIPSVDVVYHGLYIRALDTDNHALARVWKPSKPFDRKRIVNEQYIMGQVAYKKSVWEEVPYDEEFALMDDWVFLIDLAMAGKEFYQLDKDVYELVTMNDSVNINGEEDGRRSRETELLVKKLKDKYNIDAHSQITRFILDKHKQK